MAGTLHRTRVSPALKRGARSPVPPEVNPVLLLVLFVLFSPIKNPPSLPPPLPPSLPATPQQRFDPTPASLSSGSQGEKRNTSISRVSKQRKGVNGYESGASRHALAAVSVSFISLSTSGI
ncbi:hypothetical protein EYF80_030454 [Liparis tanakae]|uniref:Uncharacterized protein n=1 Tax=Liparis tanakae TaxID=230148 RepID=A0A4Z2H198_9TELE|nr:hypothetical protein EYF80_030454 [Liparis tanakae]